MRSIISLSFVKLTYLSHTMREKMLNQEIAKAVVTDDNLIDKLLYVENVDTFFLYDGRYYQRLTLQKLKKLIHGFIFASYPNQNITMALIGDIIQQMGIMVYNSMEELYSPYIALQDCLLNTDTFEFEDFDKTKIALNILNVARKEIEENPQTPNWDNFLKTALVTEDIKPDEELINLVQEMFGYYLNNSMLAPAVFFLVGSGGNGKSTMQNVLYQIIGKDNCTHMSIETLTTDQWAIAELIGVKLNICGEEESKYLRADKFKELVTGEPTQANRKFLTPIRFRPQTKYIFASNDLPTFEGVSPAIKRRIVIIPFLNNTLIGRADIDLPKKLQGEMAGIIKWAIIGGKRWLERGQRFPTTKATTKTIKEFTEEASSAIKFFNERYVVDDEKRSWKVKSDLYIDYINWCATNGRKPMNSSNFNKHILLENKGIEERVVKKEGKSLRCYNINEVIEMAVGDDLVEVDDIDVSLLTQLPPNF